MLERVSARNPAGDFLSLRLKDVTTGILVKGIDGLDPVKATIATTTLAQIPGSRFASARRESRNIVFHLGLDSRYGGGSVTEIRRRLDLFFMPGMDADLRFVMDDGRILRILGVVESNEVSIFLRDPVATISIMCFDPDLVDTETVNVGAEAFTTPSWYDLENQGTVDTGLLFEFTINNSAPSSGFELRHRMLGETAYKTLDFSANLEAGDQIRIATHPGSKIATLNRGGVLQSILSGVSTTAEWFQLKPGQNQICALINEEQTYYEMTYSHRYGGI